MYRLRGQPHMADDRNLGVDQPLDQFQATAATLDLHRFSATLFDEADGVGHALGNAGVIGAEGHVGDEHRATHRTANRAGVVQHLVDGDGQGAVEAHHHHGERVADENHVDPRLIDQPRGRIVVGGQRRDRLPEALLLLKMGNRDFRLDGRGRGVVHAAEMRNAHDCLQCGSRRYFRDAARTFQRIRHPRRRGKSVFGALLQALLMHCGSAATAISPCSRDAGSGRRARSLLWRLCNAGCRICLSRRCRYNLDGHISWVLT